MVHQHAAEQQELQLRRHWFLTVTMQVLEQYMSPSLYAVVAGSAYGERQLMQVRLFGTHRKPSPVLTRCDTDEACVQCQLIVGSCLAWTWILTCGASAQFAAQQGLTAQMRSAIKAHRDTWVTQADFSMMASLGINCVRLPVGYWVLAQTQVRRGNIQSPCAASTGFTTALPRMHEQRLLIPKPATRSLGWIAIRCPNCTVWTEASKSMRKAVYARAMATQYCRWLSTERHSVRRSLCAVHGGRPKLRGLRFPVGCAPSESYAFAVAPAQASTPSRDRVAMQTPELVYRLA